MPTLIAFLCKCCAFAFLIAIFAILNLHALVIRQCLKGELMNDTRIE
ncbi:MAG: hypothetical protein IKY98_05880 [Alphaproteobacteria bacterium]|nr:hypothetical protein [Alphaproteobacteria bacterium]